MPLERLLSLFNPSSKALEQKWPALRQRVTITVWKQAECCVMERDQRPAVDFLEPVLQIRRYGERHHHWSRDLEQRWTLDRLHVTPEMPIVVAKLAEPAAARPRLECH